MTKRMRWETTRSSNKPSQVAETAPLRTFTARYPGRCKRCENWFQAGVQVFLLGAGKGAWCPHCVSVLNLPPELR